MIITFLNQKGGVGKTTISVNLATFQALQQEKVLLVDADPQGSALNFSYVRHGEPLFPTIGIPKASLHKEIDFHKKNFSTIFIDCPPQVKAISQSALRVSNCVVIPVQPSPYDIWAAAEVVELIKEAQIFKPDLKAFFCLNRVIANTVIGRDIITTIEQYDIPHLTNVIYQRIAFAESAAKGAGVVELKTAKEAANDITKLARELFERIKL